MIQRLQARAQASRYSDEPETLDWTDPVKTDLPGTYWAPDDPAEQPAVDGAPIVETGRLLGQTHQVSEADRIRIPGVGDFTVTGVRGTTPNPFTLNTLGMVVTLRRVR